MFIFCIGWVDIVLMQVIKGIIGISGGWGKGWEATWPRTTEQCLILKEVFEAL